MAECPTLVLYCSGISAGELDVLRTTDMLAPYLGGAVVGKLHFPRQDHAVATLGSLMTGTWPDQHGLLLPTRRDRERLSFRPLGGADRVCPAFWERLALEGQTVISVGWPCALPAWPDFGMEVLDAAFGSSLAGLPSLVFPYTAAGKRASLLLETWLKQEEMPREALAAFLLPGRAHAAAAGRLAAALAENISRHAAFLELINAPGWRLATLCLDLPGKLAALADDVATIDPPAREQLKTAGQTAIVEMIGAIFKALPAGSNLILAGMPGRGEGRAFFAGPDFYPVGQTISLSALDLAPTVWVLGGYAEMRYPGRPLMEILRPGTLGAARRFRVSWQPASGPDPMAAERSILQSLGAPGINARSHYTAETLYQWQADWNWELVCSLVARGAYLEVLPLLEQRIRELPEQTWLLLYQAELLLRAELFGEALAAAQEAYTMTPEGDPDPLLLLACAHAGLGQPTEARRWLAEMNALAHPPRDLLLLATLHQHLGEHAEALALVEAHRERLPRDRVNLVAAQAHRAMNALVSARDAALEAVNQNYALAAAHRTLGEALWPLGEREAALTAFSTCACLAPNRAWPFELLARYGKLAGRDWADVEQWQLQARLAGEEERKLLEAYRAAMTNNRATAADDQPQAPAAPVRQVVKPLAITGLIGLPGAGQARLRAWLTKGGEAGFGAREVNDWAALLGFGPAPDAWSEQVLYDFPASLVTLLPRAHTYRLILCELSAEDVTDEFVRQALPPACATLDRTELTYLLMREQYFLNRAIGCAPNMVVFRIAYSDLFSTTGMPSELLTFLRADVRERRG